MTHHPARSVTRGLGAAVLGSCMTGFGGVFATLTYGMSGLVLTCWRLWFGAVFLLIVLAASGRRLHGATIRASLLPAAFLTADFYLFFCALKLTSVVDATVLGAIQPALVMVAARRMFNERLRPRDIGWILVAVAGVTVAVLGPGAKGPNALEGDLFAVGAMLMWTGYWLTGKRTRETHDALEFTTCALVLSGLFMIPVWLLSGQNILHSHASDWRWIVLLAIIPSTGHIILNYAQRYVAASISAAIGCLNPLVASVAAVPILHQPLSPSQLVGVGVGVGAVVMITTQQRHSLEGDFLPQT